MNKLHHRKTSPTHITPVANGLLICVLWLATTKYMLQYTVVIKLVDIIYGIDINVLLCVSNL